MFAITKQPNSPVFNKSVSKQFNTPIFNKPFHKRFNAPVFNKPNSLVHLYLISHLPSCEWGLLDGVVACMPEPWSRGWRMKCGSNFLCPLVKSAMLSTLAIHCHWEDEVDDEEDWPPALLRKCSH